LSIASVTVSQEPASLLSISTDNNQVCAGSSTLLSATSGFSSYQWSDENGSIDNATNESYSVVAAGNYFVTATTLEGCVTVSDDVTIYEINVVTPTNLVANSIGEEYASLVWDATSPSGVYNYRYSDDGGSTWTDVNGSAGNSAYLLSLTSGTEYTFEVASFSYGCESASISITFTTLESCDVPLNIGDSFSGNDVVISWDAVSGAQSYQILYNIAGSGWQSATVNSTSINISFSPGYSNSYYVKTNCSDGISSDWSSLQTFTFSCDDPVNYSISEESGTVTFAWDDTADNYQLLYNTGSGWALLTLSEPTYSITGLSVGTQISTYLKAVCDISSGFASNWVSQNYTVVSGARVGQVPAPFISTVFPNPTEGILNINLQSDQEQMMAVSLIDNFGKVIFTQNENAFIGELSYRLDLSSYAKGVYYLRLVSGKSVRNERVILK
jgi:hypothetical protein